MQRLDYNVLVPYLQPKLEYVLSINMTDMQRKLYKFYLENYAIGETPHVSIRRAVDEAKKILADLKRRNHRHADIAAR